MAVKIKIPTPLRPYVGGADEVALENGETVGELLNSLVEQHGALKQHLYDDKGQLRRFVNLYLNEEDIRYLDKENTAVADGDLISIVPSIAGGR